MTVSYMLIQKTMCYRWGLGPDEPTWDVLRALDDFDWVAPPYEPGMVLPRRDMDVRVMDVGRDFRVLPDVLPVVVDETAVEPLSLPVVLETGPQVGCEPDLSLSVLNVEVDIADIGRDIRNLPDVFPVMFDKTAAVPTTVPVGMEMGPPVDEGPDVVLTRRDMEVGDIDVDRDIRVLTDVCPMMFDESTTVSLSLPVVVNAETQVDVRWETTSAVVPFVDGCGRPAGWLDSESDCYVMDEIVLDPEMSPIVSVRSAAVPTFLPTMFEVFSLAVLAGGGGRCCDSPPGRGRDSHSASVCPAGCWE